MNDSVSSSAQSQSREDSRRRRKALLAGGLVLGLGAAMTLAAWSDDVFSQGSFQTGSFNLKGSEALASSTYTDYEEYPSTGPADLTTGSTGGVNFTLDSLNLSPGQTVVAPFSIATSEDTTVDGRYWLESATVDAGPLAPFLSFAIVQSATCTADNPATSTNEQTDFSTPWKSYEFTAAGESKPFGTVRSAAGVGPDIALNKAFGNQSHLCIGVTLKNDETGIKAASAVGAAGKAKITWKFSGESQPLTD